MNLEPGYVMEEMRVLVVDDEDVIRSTLEVVMADQGKVHTAKDPNEALQLLEDNRIDLILTDVMMPVMNGFEFVERVRAMPRYVHVPIIILTAFDPEKTEQNKALNQGAVDYISKPFDILEIKLKVSNYLKCMSYIRQLEQKVLKENKVN